MSMDEWAGTRAVAMETGCCVVGCERAEDRPLLFPFPMEEKLRVRWAGATGRGRGWTPREGDGVCARHFAPEQYWEEGGRLMLREAAVPALRLPPRGLEAEQAALGGGYSAQHLRRLARHAARRPALLLPPQHAAHGAALAALARDLHLAPLAAQRTLDRYLHACDTLMEWCRLRARHELGSEARAGELAPEWLREAEELVPGGPGGRGPAAAVWRALAERARHGRSLELHVLLAPRQVARELAGVWARGLELARARLELLARVGDDEGALHPGATPSFHLEDLVLLLAPDGAERGAWGAAPALALTLLFGLVQKYRLEEDDGDGRDDLARRWSLAAREYRSHHRAASVLLLQRRWHDLKVSALRCPSESPLHAAVLRRFPHLYGAPPLPWRSLVAAGRVIEQETDADAGGTADNEPLEDVAMRFQEPMEDDDVILIEKHIDTFEISDEEDDTRQDRSNGDGEGESSDVSDDTGRPPPETDRGERDDGGDVDVKLTLTPVVVVRDVAGARGWRVRGGRYVDLRRLELPPSPAPRSLANRIVFEDDDDDDEDLLTISLPEDATPWDPEWERGSEPEPEPEREPKPEPDRPETTTVPRKRVQLPDIEEVRKQNRYMLIAQVLPCPAGTAGTVGPAGPVEPAGRARERAGPGRYCCWALRARAVSAARARHASRAGRLYRPTDHSVQVHRLHCKPPCACCCAGAEHGAAGAALAAEQRALDARLLLLLPALDDAPPPVPPPAPPPPPHTAPAPRPHKPRSKKRRAASPSPVSPPSDDLQEWIRQKNLTARFFDLNLKRPVPAPVPIPTATPASTPTPANVPVSKNLSVSGEVVKVNAPPAVPPLPPAAAPLRLELMSVSEDESEEGRGRGRPARSNRGAPLGLKIVTIKRNPTNGQQMIVVRPASSVTRPRPPRSPPAPPPRAPRAGPLPRLVVVARKLTEAEIRARKVIEPDVKRPPTGDPVPDETPARPVDDLTATATHTSAGQSDHCDDTDRQEYIQYVSSALNSGGILTVAPASVTATPITLTSAPVSVTATPMTMITATTSVSAAPMTLEIEPMSGTATSTTLTSAPKSVTGTPMTLTSAPESVTVTPMTLTSAPESVTGTPMTLISAPESVTGTPMTLTSAPESVTGTPMTLTSAPESVTGTPMTLNSAPESVTGTPMTLTSSPESVTGTPMTLISAPESVTGTSMTLTSAPESVTATPMTLTSAPESVMAASITLTTATTSVSAVPVTLAGEPMFVTATPTTLISTPMLAIEPVFVIPASMSVDAASMTLATGPTSVTLTSGEKRRDLAPDVLGNKRLVFHAIPPAFEEVMFRDKVVRATQVVWEGRPLVMSCSRLQAPWAPLLGWYMLTEGGGAPPGATDLEYWVFGAAMYRLEALPGGASERNVRLVRGVPDARSCRALAERGAPLLALHVASRRVLRVAARRHGDRLELRAAAAHLAERLAEALNAVPASEDRARVVDPVVEILDDDDDATSTIT